MTTIHDVARRAGVSPVTVSRVMNGASNVNAVTREKVEQAIRDLGYVPNLAARSLRSRQTSTLALIVPDITNAFWTTVARGAEDVAQGAGYSVLLCNSDENPDKQQAYLHAVLRQRVDGVMIAPYDMNARNLQPLRELRTPTVVVDRRVAGWDLDTVQSDSVAGTYALVQHLIALGHRQIAIISGPAGTSTAEERVAGYCLALDEAGIPVDPQRIRRGEFRARSGQALTEELLDEGLELTAIVAANNVIAMGVLDALQARGKRVPQDMALVSFDELPDVARFFPFLTVVLQPAYDMGQNAAQLLISRIEAGAALPPRHVVLPNRLVLRYSCGRFLNQPQVEPVNLTLVKDPAEVVLVRPLDTRQRARLPQLDGPALDWLWPGSGEQEARLPDRERLARAFRFQPAGRLPFIAPRLADKALLEYVLERSLPYSQAGLSSGRQTLTAAEAVEFARRLAIDAIPYEINWLPGPLEAPPAEMDIAALVQRAYPPPALAEHFNRLERLLQAAQERKLGIFISLSGLLEPALAALESQAAEAPGARLEPLMELLLAQQERALRAVCDRFSAGLSFVLVREGWPESFQPHLQGDLRARCLARWRRLVAPAKEHGLPVGLSLPGRAGAWLPDLHAAGFDFAHPLDPLQEDLPALYQRWQGQLTLLGGVSAGSLAGGDIEALQAQVAAGCALQAQHGGLVLSLPIERPGTPGACVALARAIQREGNCHEMNQ